MDRCERSDRYQYQREGENPSFSSSLLDAIYRSIDEGGEEELVLYRETMRKKRSNCTPVKEGHDAGLREQVEDMASLQRACMIEKWIERKVSEKVVFRREPAAADSGRKSRSDRDSVFINWSPSSSDSSSGGGFSSSEAESLYGVSSRSSSFTPHKPKPIRTSVPVQTKHESAHQMFDNFRYEKAYASHQKPKHENGFVKTKSKAMKIYGDLKKAKQPISPGSRLANFLNSLFTAGSAKKAKISSSTVGFDDGINSHGINKSKSANASTCSSASSFSRSCLSKTPSSRGKLGNGMKRSVTFHPAVSVIVGEDCQPCGQKSLYKDELGLEAMNTSSARNSINEQLKFHIMEKNRRVEEAARNLLKNYQKKVEYEFNMRKVRDRSNEEFEAEDYEDDDAASDASSDLFELENLSCIGIQRYREELPVYETTHFDTNRAIATGLIS